MFGLGTRWDGTGRFHPSFLGWDDPICASLMGWGRPCSVFCRRDGEREDGWTVLDPLVAINVGP